MGEGLAKRAIMKKDELLEEGVLAKFLRYVRYDTASAEGKETTPSTEGQLRLAGRLEAELRAMGLEDASVNAHGFATATLRGRVRGCPAIGLLAHLDTAPGVPGSGVRPLVHEHYDGREIELPAGGVLRPSESKALARVVGHTLVTSDGATLLGADDKAGIAEIMEALCRLIRAGRPCGTLKIAFTPDEEIGSGIEKFPVETFGAQAAYTLDGGTVGEIENENFNAANYEVVISGKSAHTGTARGNMINALHLAGQLVGAIPSDMRPETTDGSLGFIHPDAVGGGVEQVKLKLLIRDFTEEGLQAKEEILRGLCTDLMRRHPGAEALALRTGGYRNMKQALDRYPKVVGLAQEAVRQAGFDPVLGRIRGGTDGARLTYRGLPTPNLFTGGVNFHSRLEWISHQWMEAAVDTVFHLCRMWGEERSLD